MTSSLSLPTPPPPPPPLAASSDGGSSSSSTRACSIPPPPPSRQLVSSRISLDSFFLSKDESMCISSLAPSKHAWQLKRRALTSEPDFEVCIRAQRTIRIIASDHEYGVGPREEEKVRLLDLAASGAALLIRFEQIEDDLVSFSKSPDGLEKEGCTSVRERTSEEKEPFGPPPDIMFKQTWNKCESPASHSAPLSTSSSSQTSEQAINVVESPQQPDEVVSAGFSLRQDDIAEPLGAPPPVIHKGVVSTHVQLKSTKLFDVMPSDVSNEVTSLIQQESNDIYSTVYCTDKI